MNLNIATSAKIAEQQQTTSGIASIKQADQEYIQLQALREKFFFSPIANNYTDKQITTELKKNNPTDNKNFYDQLDVATASELTEIFINLVDQIKLIDDFYCASKHLNDFNMLISRIKRESINLDIASRIRNICYWLYGLIKLLQNLQYQHEHSPETISISKEAIAVRLEECFVSLDLCWDGIGSRFTHEYEILNSLQQGLAGKIFLARKSLFQTLASQFINRLKRDKNYYFHASMEIHMYNLLHNLVADKLGFISIKDKFLPKLPKAFAEEFKELVTIEVSPANITRILAEQLYQELSNCLTKINSQNWLHTPKKDTELNTNLNTLEASVFAPANILYNTIEQKLGIFTIIDATEIDNDFAYSLNRSQEKLHFWVASSLMPNTKKVLIANIYNQQTQSCFSIATIDYMFFWGVNHDEYEEEPQKINFNADNYISLDLSHIQQLDFIEFNGVNINDHLDLSQHDKKTAISISLVSQALHQTNSAIIIMLFFTDNHVNSILENSPLINKKLKDILKNKLSNTAFKQCFIDEICNYYANSSITKLTKHEVFFLMQYKLFIEILPIIINNHLDISECCVTKEQQITLLQYFRDALNHIIYNIRCDDKPDYSVGLFLELFLAISAVDFIFIILDYSNYNLDAATYNRILSLAIKANNPSLKKVLPKYKNLKINATMLHDVICCHNDELYRDIIDNIKSSEVYTKNELLNLLLAKNSSGIPAIFVALINKKYDRVVNYVGFIFSLKQLNLEEKISIFTKNDTNKSWINYIQHGSYDKRFINDYIKNYIKIILSTPNISSAQALEILESKNKNGDSVLYLAMENNQPIVSMYIQDSIVRMYIKNIMEHDAFNIEEKFIIILAQGSEGSGLALAIKNNNASLIMSWYLSEIIKHKLFNHEQLFKILQAMDIHGNTGFCIAMQKNIHLLSQYLNHIEGNDILTNEQKFELLLAKSADNTTGLYVALQNNLLDIATKYIERILDNNFLTVEQKFELILAKGKNNTNTISIAKEINNLSILTDVINIILNKINSLSSSNQTLTSEQAEIYNDCVHIIDKYLSLILNNDMLNITQKEEICNATIFYNNYKNLINQSNLCLEDKQQLLHSAEILTRCI